MWRQLFLVWNIAFLINISGEEAGDQCVPNNEIVDGVCTLITDCEVALSAVKHKSFHTFQRCGFSGNYEIVCCPTTTDKFGNGTGKNTERIADRECNNIIKSTQTLIPVELHIIGGELATLGEFPYMVALGFPRVGSTNEYDFNCGGTLISNSYVVTAAHCIDNLERVKPTVARAGVVELGDSSWNDETDYRIVESIIHPEYNRSLKYNDLALLRLERPVTTSKDLSPACLHTRAADPDGPLTVTGWGRVSNTKNAKSNVLLKTSLTVSPREQCTPWYSNWRKLPHGIIARQLCAGDRQGGHDACQGDSGGPLLVAVAEELQLRLVGVTSFGAGCGSTTPGVYTRVAEYLDWIVPIVWPN